MKILIFTADFGNGHNKVATFLAQKYEAQGHEVQVLKPHQLENKIVAKTSENMFTFFSKNSKHKLIKNSYGIVFEIFSNRNRTIFSKFGEKKILEAINEYLPDLVLFTFPYQPKNIPAKSMTVVTDYGFTKNWYNDSEIYIVGNEEIKSELLEIDENLKIYNIGIPISEPIEEKIIHRTIKEGINNQFFLINLGALGICNFKQITNLIEVLNKRNIYINVICGKNKKLKTKFEKYLLVKGYKNIKIYGYVDDIQKLYAKAFMMLTKAGGVTITEAINYEIPLIIDENNSMLGQEKLNIKFIKEKNIGEILSSEKKDDIDNLINKIINEYQIKIDNMKAIKGKYHSDIDKFDLEKI